MSAAPITKAPWKREPKWSKRDLETFAEALANEETIAAAARRVGRSQAAGLRQFGRICADLGPQAV